MKQHLVLQILTVNVLMSGLPQLYKFILSSIVNRKYLDFQNFFPFFDSANRCYGFCLVPLQVSFSLLPHRPTCRFTFTSSRGARIITMCGQKKTVAFLRQNIILWGFQCFYFYLNCSYQMHLNHKFRLLFFGRRL